MNMIVGVGNEIGSLLLVAIVLCLGLPTLYIVAKVVAAAIYDARLEYEEKKQTKRKRQDDEEKCEGNGKREDSATS